MEPSETFDIDRPLTAEDISRLEGCRDSLNKTARTWFILALGLLAAAAALSFLAWVLRGHGASVVTQALFVAALVALVLAFSLAQSASNAESKRRRMHEAILPAKVVSFSPMVLTLPDSPRCEGYLRAVSAQGRSVLKMEMDGLRTFWLQERTVAEEADVRARLQERGIALP